MTHQSENFAGFQDEMRSRTDLDIAWRRRDEVQATRVIETIENKLDPFSMYNDEHLKLFTGVVASEQRENDMVKERKIGEESAAKFTGKNISWMTLPCFTRQSKD